MAQQTVFRLNAFVLTFISYAMYNIVRKTPSYVQSSLISEWTPASQPYLMGNTTSTHGSFFQDELSAEQFIGLQNTIFLFAYSGGNFINGIIGDRIDRRVFLSLGMTLSAAVMFIYGPILEWTGAYSRVAYITLQILNGLFQSTGWLCVVPIMANWFDKRDRGYVMGLWAASPSIGSILGALIVSSVLDYGYEYAFVVTCSMLLAAGVIVVFGLVTSPEEVGLTIQKDNDIYISQTGDSGETNDDDALLNEEAKLLIGKRKPANKMRTRYTASGSFNVDYKVCSSGENEAHDTQPKGLFLTGVDKTPTQKYQQTATCETDVEVHTESSVDNVCGSDNGLSNDSDKDRLVYTRHQCDSKFSFRSSNQESSAVQNMLPSQSSHKQFHGDISNGSESASSIKISPNLPEEAALQKEQSNKDIEQANPKAIGFLAALLLPGVISYSLCFFFLKLVKYVFYFWLPFNLTSVYGWTESDSDRLSLWFDAGGVVGSIMSMFLMSKLNKSALIMAIMMLMAVPLVYIYGVLKVGRDMVVNAVLLSLLGALMLGVANILSAVVSSGLCQQEALRTSTKSMATVTGILEGCGTVGAAVGQVLVPYLLAAWGWDSVFYFVMAATCLSAFFIMPIVVTEVKEARNTGSQL